MEAEKKKGQRFCPYCDEEIAEAAFPYCEACDVTVFRCPKCGKVIKRNEVKTCPSCGTKIQG